MITTASPSAVEFANYANYIGMVAAVLTTISFVPQVLKLWKTHRGEDISTAMFLIFSVGTALWFIYGLMIHSFPVVAANLITLLLSFSILGMKWRWRRTAPSNPS